MKALLLQVLCLLTIMNARAQLKPVEGQSAIGFTIRNFGIRVSGMLKGIEGNIHFDPARSNEAVFDINIDAGTINTDNSLRDDHLKGESYLDIKHYPKIHFQSTRVTSSNRTGTWILTGRLTIRGHEKEISFPFSAAATNGGYLFKGTFRIHRKDFEVGGTSTISDEMQVDLNVFAN
ncbi:YceI family protein [Flavitalea sp. BT771]|uniref:YceI family protein n=1 Tax=Flavitalea sp. BT771 TaxID=3063329 RepID=UPI0026E3FB32|nr:YceI family protein [Flavitalea sp. BT771]MDO6429561.1 YceI family protein [Flavitalea sp. BT771]MDV6218311.1 YceI family protein [Flavitalea sp. BT771]